MYYFGYTGYNKHKGPRVSLNSHMNFSFQSAKYFGQTLQIQ